MSFSSLDFVHRGQNQMEGEDGSQLAVCRICNDRRSIYSCPRCNAPYCSVACYQSPAHSACSESFYRDCVEDEIRSRGADPEAKKRMVEILGRLQDQEDGEESLDSDDDEDVENLADRLAGVDLDDSEAVWGRLTDEEKRAFADILKTGDVSKLVPAWVPWWTKQYPRPKVQFVDDTNNNDSFKSICPPVPQRIPPLSSITKVKPSPNVFYNLVNVLGGYTMCSRYYNGDHFRFPGEAASVLIQIAKSLASNTVYETYDTALESVGHEAMVSNTMEVDKQDVATMKGDVRDILKGPNDFERCYYVLSALSDIKKLLRTAKRGKPGVKSEGNFSKRFCDQTGDGIASVPKNLLTRTDKKIDYYMSWVVEHGSKDYPNMQS